MPFLRKYGAGTGADVIVPMIVAGGTDHRVGADWTPQAGDVKVSKDGAAAANIGTLPSYIAGIGWKFVFSDAELQCARLSVQVTDSATKAVEDQHFVVETYGHASAQHAFDLDTALQSVNTTQISGSSTAANNAEVVFDTDFSTNYNTTRDAWVTNVQDTVGTGNLPADAVAISGDSTAADNLEAAFDGTGYDVGGIDVSALNAAATAVGSDGSGLTEAGGTGDQLTALGTAANQSTLLSRLTATRAGYLDNLSGGAIATQADVQAITQAQRVRIALPEQLERPDSDSTDFRIWIYVYNEAHEAEDLDSVPSVTAENNAGTDRSSNLGTPAKLGSSTGIYYVDYTVASTHAIEGLLFKVTATEGSTATEYPAATAIVDTTAVDFTSADRTKLEAIHGKLPSASYLPGVSNADGTGLATATAMAAAQADLDTVTDDGVALATSQPNYAPAKAGDEMDLVDAPNSTAVTAIQNGLSTLDASGVRTALGMDNADLDDLLAAIQAEVDKFDATLPDSIPADGDRPTPRQALYIITQFLLERVVSGTTMTVKKPDGSTLMTFTLNHPTEPSSITRAI